MAALVVACTGLAAWAAVASAAPERQKATNVTLQLKWVTQAQFAGYYAAVAKGFYSKAGLNVKIKVGGPSITPEQVVAGKQADFGLDWLPNLFATREKGSNLVSIAQVFARSGMTELTWKSSGINTIKKMRGKKVGVWCCGNEPELFAALQKNGINPHNSSDVTIVNQPFNMDLFLQNQVDAAAAMTYNELAQVLETKNPKTGKLYTADDLNVISWEEYGTSMLQDAIFASEAWLKQSGNEDVAVKFLKASFKGWIFCRDNPAECVDIVLKHDAKLPKGHQTWQLNEVNGIIWPAPNGIGITDKAAFDRTVQVALDGKILTKPVTGQPWRNDLAEKALAALGSADTKGTSWKKATVTLTEGGN
jgi:NitT/TauT family transport system substrate-binding protein